MVAAQGEVVIQGVMPFWVELKTMMNSLDYEEQYLQVGVAPYIGEYGDLHTWLMLKSKKNDLTSNWDTYPVLKFFKGNALVELGYSEKSNWDIHLMYRF